MAWFIAIGILWLLWQIVFNALGLGYYLGFYMVYDWSTTDWIITAIVAIVIACVAFFTIKDKFKAGD